MKYKHSLFFDMISDAEDVQTWVEDHIGDAAYLMLSNDGEMGAIELSFYTDDALLKGKQHSLKSVAPFTCSTFNVEE